MQDFPSNVSPPKDGLIKGYKKQKTVKAPLDKKLSNMMGAANSMNHPRDTEEMVEIYDLKKAET